MKKLAFAEERKFGVLYWMTASRSLNNYAFCDRALLLPLQHSIYVGYASRLLQEVVGIVRSLSDA